MRKALLFSLVFAASYSSNALPAAQASLVAPFGMSRVRMSASPSRAVIFGDSLARGLCTSNPPATSYFMRAVALANARGANIVGTDLGRDGAVAITVDRSEILTAPRNAYAIAVMESGTNDVNDTNGSDLTTIERWYLQATADMRATQPHARYIFVTVRNFDPPGTRIGDNIVVYNQFVRNVQLQTPNSALLDLSNRPVDQPQFYIPADYCGTSANGYYPVHYRDSGAVAIASALAPLLFPAPRR